MAAHPPRCVESPSSQSPFRCCPATSHARQSLQEINFRHLELTAVAVHIDTEPKQGRWWFGVIRPSGIGFRCYKHDSRIVAQRLDGDGFHGDLAADLRFLGLLDYQG